LLVISEGSVATTVVSVELETDSGMPSMVTVGIASPNPIPLMVIVLASIRALKMTGGGASSARNTGAAARSSRARIVALIRTK